MAYETDNIAIASALRVHGFVIDKIDIHERRGIFFFGDEATKSAEAIQMGSLLVDAITFHNELRRLSSLVKSMHTYR